MGGRDEVDLLGNAQAIHRHQRVMTGVRRRAQRVLHDHDAEAEIDRIQHRRQHADVGLRPGDDDGADLLLDQEIGQDRKKAEDVPLSMIAAGGT